MRSAIFFAAALLIGVFCVSNERISLGNGLYQQTSRARVNGMRRHINLRSPFNEASDRVPIAKAVTTNIRKATSRRNRKPTTTKSPFIRLVRDNNREDEKLSDVAAPPACVGSKYFCGASVKSDKYVFSDEKKPCKEINSKLSKDAQKKMIIKYRSQGYSCFKIGNRMMQFSEQRAAPKHDSNADEPLSDHQRKYSPVLAQLRGIPHAPVKLSDKLYPVLHNIRRRVENKVGGFKIKGFTNEIHSNKALALSDTTQRRRTYTRGKHVNSEEALADRGHTCEKKCNEDIPLKTIVKRSRQTGYNRGNRFNGQRAMNGLAIVRVSSRGAEQEDQPLADKTHSGIFKPPRAPGILIPVAGLSDTLPKTRRAISTPRAPVQKKETPRKVKKDSIKALKEKGDEPRNGHNGNGFLTGMGADFHREDEQLSDRRVKPIPKKRGKLPPPPPVRQRFEAYDQALTDQVSFRKSLKGVAIKPSDRQIFTKPFKGKSVTKNLKNPFIGGGDAGEYEGPLSDRLKTIWNPTKNLRNPYDGDLDIESDQLKVNPGKNTLSPFEPESDKKGKYVFNKENMHSKNFKNPFTEYKKIVTIKRPRGESLADAGRPQKGNMHTKNFKNPFTENKIVAAPIGNNYGNRNNQSPFDQQSDKLRWLGGKGGKPTKVPEVESDSIKSKHGVWVPSKKDLEKAKKIKHF